MKNICVVKPHRGVASDGVHLCFSFDEAKEAFESLIGTPIYGGGVNDKVLVQEYARGQEYALDTVAKDGDIKVLAIWKYHKRAANGAPFCYQAAELVPYTEALAPLVDYCVRVLKAAGHRWGPTHTEIVQTLAGPRIIEVNPRWHAAKFQPIVTACLGYDALTATLDAYFDPAAFAQLPSRPHLKHFRAFGRIVHLINFREGVVERVQHVAEIEALLSVVAASMDYEAGDTALLTVDIRTDSGYVLLTHPDPDRVEDDFRRILELQSQILVISTDDT